MGIDCGKLVLVTGSPRSTTTAFHNALIAGGIYRGVPGNDLLERDPNADRNLYTDEYYPSMQLAIAWTFARSTSERELLQQQLAAQMEGLAEAFANGNGLMLKAPHYVFGLPAFVDAHGAALHVVYMHRDPFAVAASMLRHPHIGRQLPGTIEQCMDFAQFGLLQRYAQSAVLTFASQRWGMLSLLGRALFVWYLYANAFLLNVAEHEVKFFVVRNEAFDHEQAQKIVSFMGLAGECGAKIENSYHALPVADMTKSLRDGDDLQLWNLVRHVDAKLSALSERIEPQR